MDRRPRKLESLRKSAAIVVEHDCKHYAVVTTIFEVSAAVHDTCRRLPGWCLVVVADQKTPSSYDVDGPCHVIFLSTEKQLELSSVYPFIAAMPWNHFGRKNVGYLYAIASGADRLWDFDDDNGLFVDGAILESMPANAQVQHVQQWDLPQVNAYTMMNATHFAWPRGLPLDSIMSKGASRVASRAASQDDNIGVVQSLANRNPDVDAIYRLTRPLPLNFERNPHSLLVVPSSTSTPFNAQATLFVRRDILWALYLPVSVHGRVSDIWRSYIVQRLFRESDTKVAFAGPWVDQIRNPHTIMADFDAEHDLYIKSRALIDVLNSWKPSAKLFPDKIVELFTDLYERDFLGLDDVRNAQLWVDELADIGYF